MSSNVGLSTPRGSGTSGYVQRNLSQLKPRDRHSEPYSKDRDFARPPKPRQPDQQILAHEREREIESQVFDLRDGLEDEGVDEEEIEKQTTELREKLNKRDGRSANKGKGLKAHQVHELAEAKAEESERLRKALGIRGDYEEGGHWKQNEERLRGGLEEGGSGGRLEGSTERKEVRDSETGERRMESERRYDRR